MKKYAVSSGAALIAASALALSATLPARAMPEDMMMPAAMPAMLLPGGTMPGAKTFRVTIENLTKGQPFSAPVFVTHALGMHLWQVGDKASFGVQRLAEEGNTGPLVGGLLMMNGGKNIGSVAGGFGIMPGHSASLMVTADPTHPLLSGATMLVHTNDGFTGLDDVNLMTMTAPRAFEVIGYDAGTEKNNETDKYLVARMGSERDADNDAIAPHKGIRGDADAPKAWDFSGAVARITITPVADMDMEKAMMPDMMTPESMMPMSMQGARMMLMMPDSKMMAMSMKDGQMMATMPDGKMMAMKMQNGMMMMPKGMEDAKVVLLMPDASLRPVTMKDGKMMVTMPDGSMAELMMNDAM